MSNSLFTGDEKKVSIKAKTFGNLIAAEMAALKADLARVTAERDALNIEIERAHCYLDECYINDPDALDAGTKPLVDRIGDLDAAHGAEVLKLQADNLELQAEVEQWRKRYELMSTQRDTLQATNYGLWTETERLHTKFVALERLYNLRGERIEGLARKITDLQVEAFNLRAEIAAKSKPVPWVPTSRHIGGRDNG